MASDRAVGRPRDGRIDTAVLAAARALLTRGGFPALTFDAVAAEAAASGPAVRRRYRSRAHLAVVVLADLMGASPFPDTGCLRCDLTAGLDDLGRALALPVVAATLPGLVHSADPDSRALFIQDVIGPRRGSTREAVERGRARGELPRDVDPEVLLDALAGPYYYRLLVGHLPVTTLTGEDVVDAVLGPGPRAGGCATSTAHARRADEVAPGSGTTSADPDNS